MMLRKFIGLGFGMKITNWQQLVRVKVKAISEKIEMAFL